MVIGELIVGKIFQRNLCWRKRGTRILVTWALKLAMLKTPKSLRKITHLGGWEKPSYCGVMEAEADAYGRQTLKG